MKSTNYWRRVRKVAHACGITAEDLGDRLHILNLRGKHFSLDGLRAEDYDVIIIDPLYKLLNHEKADEVSSVDVSRVLGKIDEIAERGPAVCIVHHGTKGHIGDKQAIDRLSGSGVLARDFDGCFTLTPHRDHSNDWLVLETILRNYRSPDAQTIEFRDGAFVVRNDVPSEVLTSKTVARAQQAGPTPEMMALVVGSWITAETKTEDVKDRLKPHFKVGRDKAAAVIRQLERNGFVRGKSKTKPAYGIISPPDVPPTKGALPGMQKS